MAVPPDRDDEPVREFRSFTGELERLAELRNTGVLTEDEFQSQKKRILEG